MAEIVVNPPSTGQMPNTWGEEFLTPTLLQMAQAINATVEDLDLRDGNLWAVHVDGTETDLGPLPVGPGGSDAGVAGYIQTVGSQTQAALSAQILETAGSIRVIAPTSGTSGQVLINQALTIAAGRPVNVGDGDVVLDGSITVPGDLRLAPNTRIIQTANVPAIEWSGGGSGSSRGLQAAAAAGQNIVQANTVGMQVGDWVLLRSTAVWPGPKGTKVGELHQVRQIDGTTQFRTVANLDFSYESPAGSVVVFSMRRGVSVRGGRFVNGMGASMKVPMIRLTACEEPAVDTTVEGAGGPALTLSGCANFNDIRMQVFRSINDEANGNFGYGIECFGSTAYGTVYVEQHGGRHAFTTNGGATGTGVPRHIRVNGIAIGLTETAWDTHEEGYAITYGDTTTIGCRNGALKHRAPDSLILNPVVRNTQGIAVRFAPTAARGRLSGGDLRSVRYLSAGSPGVGVQIEAPDCTVDGRPAIESDDQGVLVVGVTNANIDSADIAAGKRGNADTAYGVDFTGTSSGRIGLGVDVTTGARLRTASTAQVNDSRVQPQRIDLDILSRPDSQTGFGTVQNSSASWMTTRRLSDDVVGSEFVVSEYVPRGTWQLDFFHDVATARGIYEISTAEVRGGVIGAYTVRGTIDGYASAGNRVVSSIAGIVVDRSGVLAVKVRMSGKNASATSNNGSVTKAVLIRTA